VHIGLGYLFSRTNCFWKISFPDAYDRGRSELKFKGIRSSIPMVALDINHPRGFATLSIRLGKGQNTNGEGTDSDFQSGTLVHRSRFDVSGETAFWITDIQTVFSSTSKPRWLLKPFLGWHHYEEKISMTNGLWTHLYGEQTFTPFDGLSSRYDFTWDALRAGIKGELDLLTASQPGGKPLSLKTHLALFPYMHYRGRGVWNLRDDFKKDPSFIHEAENFGVLGLEGGLSLVYRPLNFLEFEGGGRIFYSYAESGRDRTFFSNDAVVDVSLDEVTALRIGLFLQLTGRF
jgi:hypothetical protein